MFNVVINELMAKSSNPQNKNEQNQQPFTPTLVKPDNQFQTSFQCLTPEQIKKQNLQMHGSIRKHQIQQKKNIFDPFDIPFISNESIIKILDNKYDQIQNQQSVKNESSFRNKQEHQPNFFQLQLKKLQKQDILSIGLKNEKNHEYEKTNLNKQFSMHQGFHKKRTKLENLSSQQSFENENQQDQLPIIELQIDLGNGKFDVIRIKDNDSIQTESKKFCVKHSLAPEYQQIITSNIQKYIKMARNNINQSSSKNQNNNFELRRSKSFQHIKRNISPQKQISKNGLNNGKIKTNLRYNKQIECVNCLIEKGNQLSQKKQRMQEQARLDEINRFTFNPHINQSKNEQLLQNRKNRIEKQKEIQKKEIFQPTFENIVLTYENNQSNKKQSQRSPNNKAQKQTPKDKKQLINFMQIPLKQFEKEILYKVFRMLDNDDHDGEISYENIDFSLFGSESTIFLSNVVIAMFAEVEKLNQNFSITFQSFIKILNSLTDISSFIASIQKLKEFQNLKIPIKQLPSLQEQESNTNDTLLFGNEQQNLKQTGRQDIYNQLDSFISAQKGKFLTQHYKNYFTQNNAQKNELAKYLC